MSRPPVGSRVRLRHDVDRYPHFVAPAGAEGDVVWIGDPDVFAVRLDETLPGAEEWRNEVHWSDDALEHVDADVELVADYVNRDALAAASIDELERTLDEGGPAALVDATHAELATRRLSSSWSKPTAAGGNYRLEVRRTFQSMSDQALRFQDGRVVGGIDREELDRELAVRAGRRVPRASDEARDEGRRSLAYAVASSDVVLPLTREEATLIADALALLADLDEDEHTDADELYRVAKLVRAELEAQS